MRKILISLAIIGAVSAIVVGATTAFFSDVETSSGNTFTAGTLDLEIDLDGSWENPWTGPFFVVDDMKPGDQVERTISLHVDNDAYLCWKIEPTGDWDNSCTEPEGVVDGTCSGAGSGELDDKSEILIWWDDGQTDGWQCSGKGPKCNEDPYEGDNIYQADWEVVYYGPDVASNLPTGWQGGKDYPLTAGEDYYMGIKFCVGEIEITGSGANTVVSCDGSSVDNVIQSDSWTADVSFYVEQQRNNSDFTCPTS